MSAKRYEGKIAGSYDLEQTIGRGHFAVVKLARHVYSGEKVAVKVIDKTKLDDVSKAHLFQEVGCMKLVQHPNVVRLYEVIDTPSKLYLIMELGDGGDMYDFISRHERGLAEETARRYFRQIVHAINYCHRLHVVHRDLKLENVVIFEKLGIVKLTDFGFSNKFVPGRKLETSCGSLAYSAPEILLGDSYDAPAVDVWSLGVILYMLVCGELPFQEANDSETLTMIMDCKYTVPSHVSPECQDLLSKMLVRDPKKRATLQEILNHHWLTRGDPAPLPLLPLISWEHLTPEEHSLIISKMVARKMASKEEILKALEQNAYNHITATYYLLAESRLRKQREKQAHIAMVTKAAAGPRQQQPPQPNPKAKLAPLALSPRVKSADSSRSDVSTSPTLAPKQRPGTPVEPSYHLHKCSIIEEEVLEEGDEEGSQHECGDDIRHQNYMEECLSDDSDTRGSEESSASRSGVISAPKRAMPVRPLHSVRSSPQLLNQIFEEGEECEEEEEEEEDLMPPVLSTQTLTRSKHQSSPEVVHKYEMRRRRAARIQRGASHSSSDTSDTDDTESRRRRQHRQQAATGDFYRRDSSDHSSDTDGGQSGFGAGTGPLFTSHTPSMTSRASRNKSTTTEQKTSSQKSNTSKSTSSKHMSSKQKGISPTSSLLGKRDSSGDHDNSHSELGRKVSNVSTTSNMSNLSLTSTNSSRSNRYVVDTPTASSSQQPPPSTSSAATVPSSKDLEAALNEENKAKSRIIHVRSKDFSDLMERFSAGKHKDINPMPQAPTASSVFPPLQKAHDATGIKFRKRPKERMKTDINKNGLIAHADCSMEEEQANTAQSAQQQNIVKTKCCSVV